MKRKLLITRVSFLALLMVCSVFLTAFSMATDRQDGLSSGKYGFDLLSEEKTFNTTTPVYLYDLTTDEIHSSFANTFHMDYSPNDEGYTTFTATQDDPYTWVKTPDCKPCEAKYAIIEYRTTASRRGEFFRYSQAGYSPIWE